MAIPTRVLALSWDDFFLFAFPVRAIEVRAATPTPEPSPPDPRTYLYQHGNFFAMVCGYLTHANCRYINIADQLSVIIYHESSWAKQRDGSVDYAVCNKQYGCGAGQGLIMLIESTRAHCEKVLNKKIDRADPYDSIDCGIYLLSKEGIQHWEKWSGPY